MSQDDLFGDELTAAEPEGGVSADAPLAARMRPRTLEEFRGQHALLGEGGALRKRIEGGRISSMILWGPPGCGKTTLARLLARHVDAVFEPISAVTGGVAAIREVTARALERRQRLGKRTILFCDEIHRFNKGQQDAFLPHVENGTVTLVGATTENPSFEVVRPLLSRAPVVVLEPLSEDDLLEILDDALNDRERGLGGAGLTAEPSALRLLAQAADGDARRGLGALEIAAEIALQQQGLVDVAVVTEALQHRHAVYDKGGDEHYNLISALHKSVRGGDPDAALYWLARMLEGGEDPLYLARRLVRIASEDVGLATPQALSVAVAAERAYRFLGSPEGELALAEAAVFLATSPKSNAVYKAFGLARARARETGGLPVPLHLRNAPTALMAELEYGKGYQYDPDQPDGVSAQSYLPDALEHDRYYEPLDRGQEARVRERLETWRTLRRR